MGRSLIPKYRIEITETRGTTGGFLTLHFAWPAGLGRPTAQNLLAWMRRLNASITAPDGVNRHLGDYQVVAARITQQVTRLEVAAARLPNK